MRSLCLTIIASLSLASPAFAVNWLEFETSTDGSVFYIDVDSIKDSKHYSAVTKLAWFKVDHSKNKKEKARSSKRFFEAKCETEELRIRQWIDYHADDSVMNSGGNSTLATFEYVAPETVGSSIVSIMCNPFSKYVE